MNIGFEAKRFFTNYTGLGNYSRFVVDALSLHASENRYYLFTPRSALNPEVSAILGRDNVSVVEPRGVYQLAPSIWRTWGVSLTRQARSIDIFHGLSQELPFNLSSQVKKIVTVHDLIFYRYPQFYHSADVAIYKAKVKSACQRATKIIAVSKQTAQDITTFLQVDPSKIEVVYQGCHPNFKRAVTSQEVDEVRKKYGLPHNFILNVGTIEERKNLLLLIEAFSLLPKEARVPLVVVGRPTEYFQQVVSAARERRVLNEIIFLKQASFVDFPALYRGATVFVYPSLFEGFGIPLVEAIESNVPVITSTGSCFAEAAGPLARYVDPSDASALASELQLVLSDKTLREKMVRESKNHIQKFEPEKIATALNAVYQRLNG